MWPRLLPFAVLLISSLGLPGCGSSDPYDEADVLLSRKRYSPAIVIYDQLLIENPNSVRAVLGRGRAYAASGETDKALSDFNRAIELAPDLPEAYYRRAMLFEQLGEPGKARLDEEYAHSIDPQYRKAFLAMENAMVPVADEDSEQVPTEDEEVEEADEELTAHLGGEVSGTVSTSMNDFMVLTLPEPLAPSDDSMDFTDLGSSGAMSPEWQLTESEFGISWLGWPRNLPDVGEFQSPAWMSQLDPPITTAKPSEKSASKSPAAVQRPVLTPGATAPNPYVKVPVPRSGATPTATAPKTTTPTAKPTGAGNTSRPTGSPFPQAPLRGTGR